ncbi:MAG: bifunctional adenosylcobinamide kinase/adenosylcobinamide-phosphate guanylyltransferase [Anaerobacillus sp.]|uniref:bifunctional adenosylcobinamide kinase/adenosylcobinamide-phosphate guanylyltransferase n=1 Tax=Anaerobacillus sp. TaxID=1872506 RepID=UPI00391A0D21
MHFVTGGAFHGKKSWVIKNYQLNEQNCSWFNCYEQSESHFNLLAYSIDTNIIVIEGAEQIVIDLIKNKKSALPSFQNWLEVLLNWEKQSGKRELIIIGTDIGKGIVPTEKLERIIRDDVGRCFQELSLKATKVSLIWYGLQQVLKN